MPIYTLLARRRDNRPAQLTVRRQTPRRAHQMDARQRHERGQLLQPLLTVDSAGVAGLWCALPLARPRSSIADILSTCTELV